MSLTQILVFLEILSFIAAEFNPHFANFVRENFGQQFLETLERNDIGSSGSFGGRTRSNEKIIRDPIVFVHGVSDVAGGKMQALAAVYQKYGYSSGELYGTTYGHGARNNPVAWVDYSLKCEHVKQIRAMILAVRYYTLRNVDIVSYSFGVPIARKAILGGNCVESNETLGGPLTSYIDTFLGIGGPNHGISLQVAGLSIPGCVIGAIPLIPICSKIIGLYSGLCPTESWFLMDINENSHFEGRYVFSMYTANDEWIGYKICDNKTAEIPGEDGHKAYKKYSHEDILLRTCGAQIQMIQNHTVPRDTTATSFGDNLKNQEKKVSRKTIKKVMILDDYDYQEILKIPLKQQIMNNRKTTRRPESNPSTSTVASIELAEQTTRTSIFMREEEGNRQEGYHLRVNLGFE